MERHEFLRGLHEVYRPRNYLEVGIYHGHSLQLSRVPSIGVDPAFALDVELRGDVHLARATSDDFFARPDPLQHLRPGWNPVRAIARRDPLSLFREPRLDLSFIDGMHQFEYALRDFMNIEARSSWSSVIAFDDMLPREIDEAARTRVTRAWAGDVFKVILVLRRLRPDLLVVPVDTQPTGVLVVLGADPTSTALRDGYDDIVAEYLVEDPQHVPPEILGRTGAADPDLLLAAGFWRTLVRARDLGLRRGVLEQVRTELEGILGVRSAGKRAGTRGSGTHG